MVIPKFYAISDSPEQPALFTPFTLIHFLVGMYAYLVLKWIFPTMNILVGYLIWLVLQSLYEGKDIFLTDDNSTINSFGDIIAGSAGYFVGVAVLCRFDLLSVVFGGLLILAAETLVYEQ